MRTLFILIFLNFSVLCFAGGEAQIRAGNKAYENQRYGEAFELYQAAQKEGAQEEAAQYNSGAALYRLKDYDAAVKAYEEALQTGDKLKQAAYFNAGDAYFQKGDSQNAARQFRQAIVLNKNDEESVHNLQFVLTNKNDSKKNPDNKQGEDKQQQNNNDDRKDNEQGNKKKDSSKSSNDQQQQSKDKDENKNGGAPQDAKLSKDEADNILQMLKDQVNKPAKPMPKGGAQNVEKDW